MLDVATKTCSMCGTEKPVSHFWKTNARCKSCSSKVHRAHQHRKYKYGVSREMHMMMFHLQEGRCAICLTHYTERKLCVDHSHKTGKVRGLLCYNCNTAIGKLNEDPNLMSRAADYVKFGLVPKS